LIHVAVERSLFAAYSQFKVTVELAEGEMATPEIAAKLTAALKKATEGFD
jgi:hypothetical protein